MGKESVLADSGWEGEITAGVGRVKRLAFLNSLRWLLNGSASVQTLRVCSAQVVCQRPARLMACYPDSDHT